jgi:hypothetical protein
MDVSSPPEYASTIFFTFAMVDTLPEAPRRGRG